MNLPILLGTNSPHVDFVIVDIAGAVLKKKSNFSLSECYNSLQKIVKEHKSSDSSISTEENNK